jgi:hypothetical protein
MTPPLDMWSIAMSHDNRSLFNSTRLRPLLRRSLGLFCLTLGVAGVLLPVLPGWPFLLICGRLLGPHDPVLRGMLVAGHRSMRRLRQAEHPILRGLGARLTPHWCQLARVWIG